MRRVACFASVAALVAACAPRPPERLKNPTPIAQDEDPPIGYMPTINQPISDLVPRPHLDVLNLVPDFHEELRWPLTSMNHPSFEPRFAIAQAFAQPGVGWVDLCGLGVQNRYGGDKDLLAYLRGWCSAVKGDTDAACANLTPLLGTTTRGIGPAVKFDLANILVSESADSAEHWITKHNINDVEILDLLSASYFEIGMPRDAIVINRRVIDSDDHASDAKKCMRLMREIVLEDNKKAPDLKTIQTIVANAKVPDPTCLSIHHKLRCWANPVTSCAQHFVLQGMDPKYATLLQTYLTWPGNHDLRRWWVIVDNAMASVPIVGADELAIAALENIVRIRGEDCRDIIIELIRDYSRKLQPQLQSPELAKRLELLVTHCEASHSPIPPAP